MSQFHFLAYQVSSVPPDLQTMRIEVKEVKKKKSKTVGQVFLPNVKRIRRWEERNKRE
jgi:hypothetical protein